jgi:hypothetical protein
MDGPREKQRRRVSRDSTISASDSEGSLPQEQAAHNDETDEEEEQQHDDRVGESNASQMATNMLRRAPEMPGAPTGKATGLLQTKLFGKVKKPGMEGLPSSALGKRKDSRDEGGVYGHAEHAGDGKRMKTAEGIGLGIGGWVGAHQS